MRLLLYRQRSATTTTVQALFYTSFPCDVTAYRQSSLLLDKMLHTQVSILLQVIMFANSICQLPVPNFPVGSGLKGA